MNTVFIVFRLLENYEYFEGARTKSLCILENADASKENFASGKPSGVALGQAIQRIWGEKVMRTKDGPRVAPFWCYKNIRAKHSNSTTSESTGNASYIIECLLNRISLNDRWTKFKDKDNQFVLLYNTKLVFNQQRIIHEICVRLDNSCHIEAIIKCRKNVIGVLSLSLNISSSLQKLINTMSLIETIRCVQVSLQQNIMCWIPPAFHTSEESSLVSKTILIWRKLE